MIYILYFVVVIALLMQKAKPIDGSVRASYGFLNKKKLHDPTLVYTISKLRLFILATSLVTVVIPLYILAYEIMKPRYKIESDVPMNPADPVSPE